MCSIGEDDFGDDGGVHAMVPECPDAPTQQPKGVCKKCGKLEVEVYKLSFREAECRDCFLLYVRHKFRAALGSSKILPRDSRVLLVFDGRPDSLVLLDMLYHAQTQNTFKRLHCTAKVLYIVENLLLESTEERQLASLKAVHECLKRYEQFESFVIPVSAMQPVKPYTIDSYVEKTPAKNQEFLGALQNLPSLTSRQDFLKHHRSRLMASAAVDLDCQFVFQADTSVNLATQLMAAVALGRGGSAALDVSLVDDRLAGDVKLVRPLKDLNKAEVQLYLQAEQLDPPVKAQHYGVDQGGASSLQNLTQAFMDNLQENFSSTVSTVFRTGDKIAANRTGDLTKEFQQLHVNDQICEFCHSPLDYENSTTLLAIEFSRLVSEVGTATSGENEDLHGEAQTKLKSHQRLCYACRNIFAASNDAVKTLMPSRVVE